MPDEKESGKQPAFYSRKAVILKIQNGNEQIQRKRKRTAERKKRKQFIGSAFSFQVSVLNFSVRSGVPPSGILSLPL